MRATSASQVSSQTNQLLPNASAVRQAHAPVSDTLNASPMKKGALLIRDVVLPAMCNVNEELFTMEVLSYCASHAHQAPSPPKEVRRCVANVPRELSRIQSNSSMALMLRRGVSCAPPVLSLTLPVSDRVKYADLARSLQWARRVARLVLQGNLLQELRQ